MERVPNLIGEKSLISNLMNTSFFYIYRTYLEIITVSLNVLFCSLFYDKFYLLQQFHCDIIACFRSYFWTILFRIAFLLWVCTVYAKNTPGFSYHITKVSTVCEAIWYNMCLNVWKSMLWLYRIEHVIDFCHKLFVSTEARREMLLENLIERIAADKTSWFFKC